MKALPIYLEPWAAKRAKTGKFRFVALLMRAAEGLGYKSEIVAYDPLASLALDPDDETPALYWRMRPATKGGRVFREAWQAPYWRIERSYERWAWQIAMSEFDEGAVDRSEAKAFCRRLRDRYDLHQAQGNATIVALQADILRHRSFQTMAPIDMIRDVAAKVDGPIRIVTHPNADPTEEERAALLRVTTDPRITLHKGPTQPFLPDGKAFVTQNSTTALPAWLSGLPVTLYAKSDFHHINAPLGSSVSSKRIEAYVYWFLSQHVIRAGQRDVIDQIRNRLVTLGF